MPAQRLEILPGFFAIHQFAANAPLPPEIAAVIPVWVARTDEELSIVCGAEIILHSKRVDEDWQCLQVIGPFDLSTTVGVLSVLTGVLAAEQISVFALSTFNTDYLLVKADRLAGAVAALRAAGHMIDIAKTAR
jgi:uncharacterized protein